MYDPRDEELRFKIPLELMQMLDALKQAKGYENRGDLLIPVLEAFVTREVRAATVLLRIARINPLERDRERNANGLGGTGE